MFTNDLLIHKTKFIDFILNGTKVSNSLSIMNINRLDWKETELFLNDAFNHCNLDAEYYGNKQYSFDSIINQQYAINIKIISNKNNSVKLFQMINMSNETDDIKLLPLEVQIRNVVDCYNNRFDKEQLLFPQIQKHYNFICNKNDKYCNIYISESEYIDINKIQDYKETKSGFSFSYNGVIYKYTYGTSTLSANFNSMKKEFFASLDVLNCTYTDIEDDKQKIKNKESIIEDIIVENKKQSLNKNIILISSKNYECKIKNSNGYNIITIGSKIPIIKKTNDIVKFLIDDNIIDENGVFIKNYKTKIDFIAYLCNENVYKIKQLLAV